MQPLRDRLIACGLSHNLAHDLVSSLERQEAAGGSLTQVQLSLQSPSLRPRDRACGLGDGDLAAVLTVQSMSVHAPAPMQIAVLCELEITHLSRVIPVDRHLRGCAHSCRKPWSQTLQASAACASWADVSKRLLSPDVPFTAHQALSDWVFRSWNADSLGPHPLWCPTPQTAASTNAAAFMREHSALLSLSTRSASVVQRMRSAGALAGLEVAQLTAQWERLHEVSISHPDAFWPAVLQQLGFSFAAQPMCILEIPADGNPDHAQWFPGAQLNVAACAMSGPKHDPDAAAVVAGSERDGSRCACIASQSASTCVCTVLPTCIPFRKLMAANVTF